jgi:pyruvate/2-oxoglutarate dehydrogenase complex dihydrolipoamide dehydrogenase (E3) component/uncharacterized membrane protein YdjX (TVP38/TMEM64 family)
MGRRRLLLLAVLAAVGLAGALAVARGGIDLGAVRALVAQAEAARDAAPFAAAIVAFLVYVAVAALSIPLAVWLTLAIGALFGFWWGFVIVSFGATAGACLAFLAARHLAREAVRRRLGARLAPIEQGIARDGAFYLFTLRVVPVVPFFVVNLAMGLTGMRQRTFWWASQIGMLPGTAVYVNAGTELAGLSSPADILSPGLVIAFVLLGLLPWVARGGIALVRRRRLYRRWPRPKRFDRNLVVIGAGSAGLVASYVAAALRARVTLIEQAPTMGGDCLNTGCVPSKALIRAAHAAHAVHEASEFGILAGPPRTDWRGVMAHVERAIATIAPNDSAERYRGLGVEVISGRGRLVSPWTVEVEGPDGLHRLTTRAVVIATGAAPVIPPIPGLEEAGCLTSETLWTRLAAPEGPPARLVILGGGPIGCELAQALCRLGLSVTLLEALPRLLPREEAAAAEIVQAALIADGVEVLTGARVVAAGRDTTAGRDASVWVELADGRRVRGAEILVAAGRRARLEGLGLEALGIPIAGADGAGGFGIDEGLRTFLPNILAAGDVTGAPQFTHRAGHQGAVAALNGLLGGLLGGPLGSLWRFRADRVHIPSVTYTDPEVARIGLSRAEAAARGIAYETTRHDFAHNDRAITEGDPRGFVEVLTAPGRDRILGVTIVGAQAGELAASFAIAMQAGVGLRRILATVLPYPTRAEAAKRVAGAWRQQRTGALSLALLERFNRWRRGGTDV